jgi:flagellar hook-associated protein FlgK
VEEIAPSDAAAADTTESLQTILVLVKSMANSGGAETYDSEARALINSIQVERRRNQAVVTATIPTALLQQMMSSPQNLHSLPVPNSGKKP